MRIIDFSAEQYDLLLTALHVTQKQLTIPEMRVHGRILDKLEAAGIADAQTVFGYKSVLGGGTVGLENAEFDLLKDCYEKTPWAPKSSRAVSALYDILIATKQT